jgi:transcriptional regulator with XRE-family HTH domain
MEELGQRIKEERIKRGYTIESLATMTELSKGFISLIERGKAKPSITTLKKIAEVFNTSVVSLFGTEGNFETSNNQFLENSSNIGMNGYITDIKVVREASRKRLKFSYSTIDYEVVTPDMFRKMQVLHLKLYPGEVSGKKPFSSGIGEKCALVLKGELEYTVGNFTTVLHAGDSIYFPSSLPQSWKGVGTEPIEAIIMMTPPWF